MKTLHPILTLLPVLTQAFPSPSHSPSTIHPPHGPPGHQAPCAQVTCAPRAAAHIIVTRGSTEAVGKGILDPVAEAIVSACPGSSVSANPYPALLDPYLSSEAAGLGNLTEMALEYASCCGGGGDGADGGGGPQRRRHGGGGLVFLGYSQGAQITADFLCGTSEVGFAASPGYAAAVAADVSAVVLVGDPSFVKGLPWDRSNATNGSYFPRLDTAGCLPVADKMISYCDSGDYFCDNGTSSDAILIHESYAQKYHAQIVEYVVGKIEGCGAAAVGGYGAGGCE